MQKSLKPTLYRHRIYYLPFLFPFNEQQDEDYQALVSTDVHFQYKIPNDFYFCDSVINLIFLELFQITK